MKQIVANQIRNKTTLSEIVNRQKLQGNYSIIRNWNSIKLYGVIYWTES